MGLDVCVGAHHNEAMPQKQDPKTAPQTPENNDKSARHLAHLEAKRAQNLRDNLLRRKAQTKARKADEKSV